MVIIASVETAVRSMVQCCNRPSPAQRCALPFGIFPLDSKAYFRHARKSTLHYVRILWILSCTASRKTKESVHLNNVATTTSIQN